MNKYLFITVLVFTASISCKERKEEKDIVIRRPKVVASYSNVPKKVNNIKEKMTIDWSGRQYETDLEIVADDNLPLVKYDTEEYFENTANIKVYNSDGTALYNRTFKKQDMAQYLSGTSLKDKTIVGLVFNKVKEERLYFILSIGIPDMQSEEELIFQVSIAKDGSYIISKLKDTELYGDVDKVGT